MASYLALIAKRAAGYASIRRESRKYPWVGRGSSRHGVWIVVRGFGLGWSGFGEGLPQGEWRAACEAAKRCDIFLWGHVTRGLLRYVGTRPETQHLAGQPR